MIRSALLRRTPLARGGQLKRSLMKRSKRPAATEREQSRGVRETMMSEECKQGSER